MALPHEAIQNNQKENFHFVQTRFAINVHARRKLEYAYLDATVALLLGLAVFS